MKRYPKERYFKTKKEMQKYIVKEKVVADKFYVALCELYKQSNPKIKIPKIGDEVIMKHEPSWYFLYRGKVWPVYSNDPGQCDDINIDGVWYSGGAYNFDPIPEFCHYIDQHYRSGD